MTKIEPNQPLTSKKNPSFEDAATILQKKDVSQEVKQKAAKVMEEAGNDASTLNKLVTY